MKPAIEVAWTSTLLMCMVTPVSVVAQAELLAGGDLEPGPHFVGFEVIRDYDMSRSYVAGLDSRGDRMEHPRPMLVGVWYPATEATGKVTTFGDYVGLVAEVDGFEGVSDKRIREARRRWASVEEQVVPELEALLQVTMRARRYAPRVPGTFPTIIYSPGGGGSIHENAILFEFLASHGYIVAAIPSFWRRDVTKGEEDFDLAGVEVGTVSYSWGGLADIVFAKRNDAVRATVSLDGGIGYADLLGGLDDHPQFAPENLTPHFLHFVSKGLAEGDRFWADFHPRLQHTRWTVFTFDELMHADFSNASVLEAIHTPGAITEDERRLKAAGVGVIARHTLGFFDMSLKGAPAWEPPLGASAERGVGFRIERPRGTEGSPD